jgi:HEAT repeat protein
LSWPKTCRPSKKSPLPRRVDLRILSVAAFCVAAGCYGADQAANPQERIPQLTALLQDRDIELRRTAAQSLGKIGDPSPAPALVSALHDPDPLVRQYSAWALGHIGEAALPIAGMALVEALAADPAEEVKRSAAEALGQMAASEGAAPKLVGRLTALLENADSATKRAAVMALASIEAGSSYTALTKVVHDENPRNRQAAVAALGELADRRAIPLLADRVLKDADAGVRAEAAFRLGKLGDETTLAVLRAAASNDPDPAVRRWAASAIQSIKGEARGNGQ